MSDMITINNDSPTDEIVAALELLLSRLVDRLGTGMVVGMLFGTAVLMTVEDADRHV